MTDGADGIRHALHRQLWQRLPRSWRREGLFRVTALLAQRPTPRARPTAPVIVAGALRTASGLGESARLCHDALKVSGLPVFGIDLTAGLMQPLDTSDFGFADGGTLEGPATLIVHVNSPLVPLALWRLGRVARNKYVIGYWAWELPDVPPDWRHGIPFVHEIWVPSAFTADAVRQIAGDRPVRVVPHPVALRGPAAGPRVPRPDRPFTALLIFNMASSFARKNPLAAINAFRKAFGDDVSARLIVKTSNGRQFSTGISSIKEAIGTAHNIVLIDRTMSAGEIEALYHESDIVMSLHRSEGFGLTLAEAMLRGLPVVATNWSGNVDFVNAENGIPIPYRLIAAEDPQGTYHHPGMKWADADVEAAAEALRRLRREPELARTLGEAGAAYAARAWSAQCYAESVRRHLGL
ncbi:MAG: glycosyltransferase family 4 protein [Pseudolabrys sp.]|nr:glycosyltransferase family 4 protein [Pseudolabrys sp.]